jgi:hypothetical protein
MIGLIRCAAVVAAVADYTAAAPLKLGFFALSF